MIVEDFWGLTESRDIENLIYYFISRDLSREKSPVIREGSKGVQCSIGCSLQSPDTPVFSWKQHFFSRRQGLGILYISVSGILDPRFRKIFALHFFRKNILPKPRGSRILGGHIWGILDFRRREKEVVLKKKKISECLGSGWLALVVAW